MKELSSAQIRQMYLDFFAQKGHDIMKSAPLVPQLYFGSTLGSLR